MVAALRKLGPNASAEQIRQFVAGLADFPGIDGVYNFKASPERGLGPDSAIAVTYDPVKKAWVWLTKPGGMPLN